MKAYDQTELLQKVEERLPKKRFRHTLGVAYTAANLAMCYGCDMEKAFLAGLFHDIAKCYSDQKLLEKCQKYNLTVTEAEQNAPYLLHGKLGAYQTEHKYHITDPDILDAICYHTTGKPDMSLLGKIIFTADYIEPGRTPIEGLSEIRSMVYKDLDKAVCRIMENTIGYLKKSEKKKMDPMTLNAYAFYQALTKEGTADDTK